MKFRFPLFWSRDPAPAVEQTAPLSRAPSLDVEEQSRRSEIDGQMDAIYELLNGEMEKEGKKKFERAAGRQMLEKEEERIKIEAIQEARRNPLAYVSREFAPGVSMTPIGHFIYRQFRGMLEKYGLLQKEGREGEKQNIRQAATTGDIQSLRDFSADMIRELTELKDERKAASRETADAVDRFLEGRRKDTPPRGTEGPGGRGGRK